MEVGGRVWFVYLAGGLPVNVCLMAPAPLAGKPSLHGAAFALFQILAGLGERAVGRGAALFSTCVPLPPIPP